MNFVSVGLVTTSINPVRAVPLEFAAVLPNDQEFQCFFHHEYITLRFGDLERVQEIQKRSEKQKRFSEQGFRNAFLEFLEGNKYPSQIFTIAARQLEQITYPIVRNLLEPLPIQWSYTHFDPCALMSQKSDEFILSWAKACDNYDVDVPRTALDEARLVKRMMKDFI